jgi:bifunctional NMN adenylyltransferase/nudix hydrolase
MVVKDWIKRRLKVGDLIVLRENPQIPDSFKGMPGRGYYALPGGFVKPTETLVQAAVRSAEEKAGIILDKNLVYHSVVFDQPERSLRGRTITHTFLFKLGQDYTKALRNADWINVNQLFMYEEEIFEDHKLIIQSLV